MMGFGIDYLTPTFADSIYNKKIAKEGVGSAFFFRCQMGFGSDCVTPTFADSIYNKKIAKEGLGLPSFFAKPCIAERGTRRIRKIRKIRKYTLDSMNAARSCACSKLCI